MTARTVTIAVLLGMLLLSVFGGAAVATDSPTASVTVQSAEMADVERHQMATR